MGKYNSNSFMPYKLNDSVETEEPDIYSDLATVDEPAQKPAPTVSEFTAAVNLIAGTYGETESDIREALSAAGHDYETILGIKQKILEGTYFGV